MTETAILAAVVAALWGIVLALLGVVWSTLRERSTTLERAVDSLQAQNTTQETAIARLTERAIAREDAHAQHREDTNAQFTRLEATIAEMNRKLDRLLSGGRGPGTPYPSRYMVGSDPEKR